MSGERVTADDVFRDAAERHIRQLEAMEADPVLQARQRRASEEFAATDWDAIERGADRDWRLEGRDAREYGTPRDAAPDDATTDQIEQWLEGWDSLGGDDEED